MTSRLCVYAPGPWGDCLDLGCRKQGGRCEYVGGRRGRDRCVCRLDEPSRNVADVGEEQVVEPSLDLYRNLIAGQPACADPDFSDRLRRFRAGDEQSGREILGSCLSTALGLVESLPDLPRGLTVLDAVQEANAGLVEALRSFTGSTADEFMDHARRTILAWLDDLNNQQD